MIITDVKTILLTGPSTDDRFLYRARRTRSVALVEIRTDRGLTGVGETYAGYFCPELAPQAVEFFKPVLIDQRFDPETAIAPREGAIDVLWQRMYDCGNYWCRVGFGAAVLSAIEAALWDLAGKALKTPVYQLLGGAKHDSLACYATGGAATYPKNRLMEQVDSYLVAGFKAFKLGTAAYDWDKGWTTPSEPEQIIAFERDKVEFLRKHVGPEIGILIDGHMGNSRVSAWSLSLVQRLLKALEPFDLFLFEEPLPYTDPSAYAALAESSSIPVAGGECLSAPCEWLPYIRDSAFDIAQPDASWVGGLRPFLAIADLFARQGKRVATHAWSAGVGMMQNLHAGFAADNTCILEIPPNCGPLHRELIGDSFVMRDGRVLPPTTPGLGVNLTEALIAKFPFRPGSGEFNSVPGKVLVE